MCRVWQMRVAIEAGAAVRGSVVEGRMADIVAVAEGVAVDVSVSDGVGVLVAVRVPVEGQGHQRQGEVARGHPAHQHPIFIYFNNRPSKA